MNINQKTASKTYLWLLPLLSVPLLFLIKNNTDLITYIMSVLLHLTLTVLSISRFRAGSLSNKNKALTASATLLILGSTFTFISATTFPTTALSSIAADLFGHYWTSAGFFISELVFLLAMNRLRAVLILHNAAPHRSGFIAIMIGGILWFIHLGIRLTVMVWAADELSATGVTPEYYEKSDLWIGVPYAAYMLLTYAGFIAFGLALRQTSLVPSWLSRFTILFGLVTPVLFAIGIGPFRMPIAIQIMPWLIGMFLIDSPDDQAHKR